MHLIGKIGIQWVGMSKRPQSRYILLSIGQVVDKIGNVINNDEAYRVDVQRQDQMIGVVGTTATGLMYGVQSTWSLYDTSPQIPEVTIVDYPRFGYRGRHF